MSIRRKRTKVVEEDSKTFQLSTLLLSTVSGAFITLLVAWLGFRGVSEERVKDMNAPIIQQQERQEKFLEGIDDKLIKIDEKVTSVDKSTTGLEKEVGFLKEKIDKLQKEK